MEFRRRFSELLEGRGLHEALDALQKDIEEQFTLAINGKHAPIMVPRVTIDAAHSQQNFAAASASAIAAAFSLQNTATSTSASVATAVEYLGRGVLTKFAIMEVTAGATNSRTFGAKLTIDGNVVYDVSNALTRESAIRVIVGNLVNVSGTNLGFLDEAPGLPFNSQCKLEFTSDGTRTLTAAWKIAKKL